MDIKEVAGFKMIVETPMEQYRYDTFWTKEPETIAWINDMQPGEVLYDVGANIGIYTLYAASKGINVVAIEPVLENFHRLVQNVELNGFDKVIPIYAAVGRQNKKLTYEMSNLAINKEPIIGSTGAQIGRTDGKILRSIFKISTETLKKICLQPNYIKIDIDGEEYHVLVCRKDDEKVKSILVEINPVEYIDKQEYIKKVIGNNYTTDNKYNTMTPHSRERRQREGIKAENVVFTRIT